jgi:hypothetical protein
MLYHLNTMVCDYSLAKCRWDLEKELLNYAESCKDHHLGKSWLILWTKGLQFVSSLV